MIEDLRKSIGRVLYERVASPFYGTLVFSWCIWNWKILYLLFWENEKMSFFMKIHLVNYHFNDLNHLLVFPLISTATLLSLGNLISNGAYWLNLNFEKWKIDKKQKVEKLRLLSIEDSVKLMLEVEETGNRFEKIINNKDREIEDFKNQVEKLKEIQKFSKEKINIHSDSTTYFLSSPTYSQIPTNVISYAHTNSNHYWAEYNDFDELRDSFWISHNKLIDDIEAEEGGIYNFQKSFEIPSKPDGILSALLYFVVDDHCNVKLNNISIGNYSGYKELHAKDITDYIKPGVNNIFFSIQNDNGFKLRESVNRNILGKKGTQNPYGIKYKISINFIKS